MRKPLTKKESKVLMNILNAILTFFSLSKQEIFFKTRNKDIVIPRQIFYFFAYRLTSNSYCQIISFTNENFDYEQTHATLIHAVKTIDGYCETDKGFYDNIRKIRKEIETIKSHSALFFTEDILKITIEYTINKLNKYLSA